MSNKMALDALTAALDAMEHMANTLNNIDAVDEEEDAQHDAAFEAVRAAIAALQAEPQPAPVHPNHRADLRYVRKVLDDVRTLALVDGDKLHGDVNAAIVGMDYIIRRTEDAASASPALGWRPISEAPEKTLVMCMWLDAEDTEHPERYAFDFFDEDVWQNYFNEHEHYLIAGVAKGRSEDAPYTHWAPIPTPPKD